MGTVTNRPPSANEIVAGVAGRTIWQGATVSYAFATNAATAEAELDGLGNFRAIEAGDPVTGGYATDVEAAVRAWERVCDLNFVTAANPGAATVLFAGMDNLRTQSGGALAGESDFPGTNTKPGGPPDYEAYVFLNTSAAVMRLDPEPGGGHYRRGIVLHELGHALGLAHPFDSGNGSAVWPGSSGAITASDDPLESERYTVFAYEVGDPNAAIGRDDGHAVTPMAIDIAAAQELYGANNSNHAGATTYTLQNPGVGPLDVNGDDGEVRIASAYYCVWDTGGTDDISYGGGLNALINLNEATLRRTDDAATLDWLDRLRVSPAFAAMPAELRTELVDPDHHAGGFLSRLWNPADSAPERGGFSIARGAVVENATGGGGDDILVGNAARNRLRGGGGDDFVLGGHGNDLQLRGDAGRDVLAGGFGNDVLEGDAGADILEGDEGIDELAGGADGDILRGGAGRDLADYSLSDAALQIDLTDAAAERGGDAAGDTLADVEDFLGSRFADDIRTGNVANLLEGGAGNDVLDGGGGFDTAFYQGSSVRYLLSALTGGGVRVEDTLGQFGVDILRNMEEAEFAIGPPVDLDLLL